MFSPCPPGQCQNHNHATLTSLLRSIAVQTHIIFKLVMSNSPTLLDHLAKPNPIDLGGPLEGGPLGAEGYTYAACI